MKILDYTISSFFQLLHMLTMRLRRTDASLHTEEFVTFQ